MQITTVKELYRILESGAHVVQTAVRRTPASLFFRDVFYVQHGTETHGVSSRALSQAMRAHRLKPDEAPTEPLQPRIWRLQPRPSTRRGSHGI